MTQAAESSQQPEASGRVRRHMPVPFVARPGLEEALRDALNTGPGVQLIGDAGLGKTRLAEHVLSGMPHLAVSCAHLRGATARTVVAALLQESDPRTVALVGLLRGTAVGSGAGADEGLLLRAAGHSIASHVPPVSILVDDAGLLSRDEAEALAQIVITSERSWVFASRRPIDGLALPVIEVPGFTSRESTALLEALLPGAPADVHAAVLSSASDSPLFLEQCAQLLLENGAVRFVDGTVHLVRPERVTEVPRPMRAFVDDRLDLLSSEEEAVLGVAAVLGARADLALLQFLVGGHAHLVDSLINRGLLRRATDEIGQPCARFSHALVREASRDRVPVPERIATHRAAAEWYAVLPVSQVLESQAFHLEAAATLEEPDCDLLRRTVDAMVLFARSIEEERTLVCRETLLRAQHLIASRPECGADALSLHLSLASVSLLAGREEAAAAAAREALALAEDRGDTRARAEAHLHLGRVVTDTDPGKALAELDRAAQGYAEAGDPGGEARVEVARGFVHQHARGLAQQLAALERSYALAMRSADTRLQASCAQQLAMHHAYVTGQPGYEVWAERARDSSRADDLAVEPRLLSARGSLAMYGLDPISGRATAREAKEAGRSLGLRDVYTNALIDELDLAVLAGDLVDARQILVEARELAASRPAAWWDLQFDLVEARLFSREGDVVSAMRLLERVAGDELAENRVLQHDLAEARAWIALERGRFGEARALAAEAVAIDLETGERCPQLRPRLVELVATVAAGENVSLSTIADLRSLSRDTGLGTVAQLATRWLYVDELTRGWSVDLHGVQPCEVVECRALDLEIEALSSRRWALLREAAEVWSELGTTVWQARALLWHSELTRTRSPEADELLTVLQSPEGLAETLRAQVRGLRG